MRVDRNLFQSNFDEDQIPIWECSLCKKGKVPLELNRVIRIETGESLKDRDNHNWEPYWIQEVFIGSMKCTNTKCQETYTITGLIQKEENFFDEAPSYISHFYPHHIYPVLHLFKLPEETPISVEEAIINSFKLFWVDKSACVNAIRSSVEIILNDKRVIKTETLKSKKRRNLSLHQRIEIFEKKNSPVAKYLMAIKWIGNAGSHIEEIDIEDVLNGFDLLKYSIEKLYTSHEKDIAKITNNINRKKKP